MTICGTIHNIRPYKKIGRGCLFLKSTGCSKFWFYCFVIFISHFFIQGGHKSMSKSINVILCIILTVCFTFSFIVYPAAARTMPISNGDSATIQDAINQAAPGDTVLIPAGEYTINKTVVINKPLILKGAGTAQTTLVSGNVASFSISADDVRIEGIKFVGRPGTTDDRAINVGNVRDFCIINCEFNNISRAGVVVTGDDARGVISGSDFIDIYAGSGVVVYGEGSSNWNKPLDLGSQNAVFVEDCYFLRNWHGIASNNGSKYVFRYNEVEIASSTPGSGCPGPGIWKRRVAEAMNIQNNL